jgi:hypothetical protein
MKQLHAASTLAAALAAIAASAPATAQIPNRPILTEVFQNPFGNDGPIGRDPANRHQEYLEIYLPPLASLSPSLPKDSLDLTIYEVEGDATSAQNGLVTLRIDLPTFDLDPSNGLTGLARPSSGVVVIGWVDYVGNPPTGLAGTPSTRVGLVNGGITSASSYTFIALNGTQFTGTTNFPVPVAVSALNLTTHPSGGKIAEGSAAYLLVNRDSPGYVSLCDATSAGCVNSFPDLAFGSVLQTSALLDAFAGNDDAKFDPTLQPLVPGDGIDLESVLPFGGVFSNLVPQVDEQGGGYARRYVDVAKTTENASSADDDPGVDYLGYRSIADLGPLGPTPGVVHLTSSAAELELADARAQVFEVLTGTLAYPGMLAANLGGFFGMSATTAPTQTANKFQISVRASDAHSVASGQTPIYPKLEIIAFPQIADGTTLTSSVTVDASKLFVTDPNVVNPSQAVTATYRAIKPVQGKNAANAPFQATAFAAIQGLPNDTGLLNEFVGTPLGQFVAANLGVAVDDEREKGALLVNGATDLSNPAIVRPWIATLPTLPAQYIDVAGPPGRESLVQTVLTSADQVVTGSYDDSFNAAQTLVKAREFSIAPTKTKGGKFWPTDRVWYVDSTGRPQGPAGGLSNVRTTRSFELALLDTNVLALGNLETGQSDDFGIVVKAGRVRAGSPVLTGEFIALSFTGGYEGADIDDLDVPQGNGNMTNILYLDLDNLDTQLGVETITALYVVDGSGASDVDVIECFSLAVDGATAVPEPALAHRLVAGLCFALLAWRLPRTRRAALRSARIAENALHPLR